MQRVIKLISNNDKLQFIFLGLFLLNFLCIKSQNLTQYYHTNGGVIECKDFVNSQSNYYLVGNYSNKIQLVKTDSNRTMIWSKEIMQGEAAAMAIFNDSSILIVGRKISGSGYVTLVLKTNLNGDTIWTKKYFTTYNNDCWSIIPDGNKFVLVGRLSGNGLNNNYIMKIDDDGNIIWVNNTISAFATPNKVIKASNNHFAFVTKINNNSSLILTDSLGNFVWENNIQLQLGDMYSVIETITGDFIITGSTENSVRVSKIDASGNTLITKNYQRQGFSLNGGSDLVELNNSIFVVGYSSTMTFPQNSIAQILKLDSNLDTIWTKTILGAKGAVKIKKASSNKMVIGGNAQTSFLTFIDTSGSSILTSKGNLDNDFSCFIYPNPTSDKLFFNISTFKSKSLSVRILDNLGNLIDDIIINSNLNYINISYLQSGLYFTQFFEEGNIIANRKFIKI